MVVAVLIARALHVVCPVGAWGCAGRRAAAAMHRDRNRATVGVLNTDESLCTAYFRCAPREIADGMMEVHRMHRMHRASDASFRERKSCS